MNNFQGAFYGKDYFSGKYSGYTGGYKLNAGLKEFFKRQLSKIERYKPGKGLKICDIGCAFGFFLKMCEQYGYTETYGVDISEYAIKHAKSYVKSKLILHDISKAPPFPQESFDCITCFEVLEHLRDPSKVIRFIAQNLDWGGIFVMSTPNPWSYLYRRIIFGFRDKNPSHISLLSPSGWCATLKNAGLKILEVKTVIYHGNSKSIVSEIWRLVSKLLCCLRLGYKTEIVAIKEGERAMENKNILILFPDFFRDNYVVDFPGSYSFFRLIRKLAEKNRVTVVGFGKEETDHRIGNIGIINLRKNLFCKTNILYYLFYRYWIVRKIGAMLEKKPDLIICQLCKMFCLATLLKKAYHSQVMLRLGGVGTLPEKFKCKINRFLSIFSYLYYRSIFKAAELIISTFDGSKVYETMEIFGIEKDKVRVFRNGIDYKNYNYSMLSKKIVIIQRLTQEKSVNLAIEAFAVLRNTYGYDYTLSIIGDGPERYKLEKLARKRNCLEFVSFLGYRRDIYPLIKDAKLIWAHFGPNTAIEAVSINRPCIIIDMGHTKEMFKDISLVKVIDYGKYGVKPSPKEKEYMIDELVKKTIEISDNYEHITGLENRKQISRLFKDWDSRINDEIEAIDSLFRKKVNSFLK